MISTRGSRDPAPQAQAEPADGEAPDDLAHDDGGEGAGCFAEGEAAGTDRDDREAVEDQRGGIVGDAFAFQHQQEPARQPQPARERERCDRVGRRYDRAEQKADRPGQPDHVMRRHRDGAGGEYHCAEGEQENRPQVETEFPPAHGDGGGIEQGRQDHQQHQLGREFDAGQAGNEREADARDHQQNGGRDIQPAGEYGDRD